MTALQNSARRGTLAALARYGVKTAEGLPPAAAVHPFMPARPGAISAPSTRAAVARAFPRPAPAALARPAMMAARGGGGGLGLAGMLGLGAAGALGAGVASHMAHADHDNDPERLTYAPMQGSFA